MGCKCSYINDNVDDYTFELYRTTIIKHKISENTKHIRNLIRIQSRIRGMQTREKLKNLFNQSKYNTPNRLTTISTSRISDLEINSLFNQYPPLSDGIPVTLRSVEFENKSIYYGEMAIDGNFPHGRGITIWNDGSRYEGYWENNKANGKGKLVHSDGDIYEGEWKNDKSNGYGVYKHTDGATYKGN